MIAALPLGHRVAAFLGSWLAFQLELAAAKSLLPRYGGGACVWTTSLMLFQGLVVAAALYAGLLRRLPLSRRAPVHLLVVLLGLASPLVFGAERVQGWPVLAVCWELLRSAGPAFFALAAISAVLDDWLGEEGAGGLFAASNAGALAGLAAFPLLLEPLAPLPWQRWGWRVGYAAFAAVLVSCRPREDRPAAPPRPAGGFEPAWLLAAAAPSAALLAATHALGLDLAAGPLLWAAPLALYLATFTWTFGRKPLDPRRAAAALGGAALVWLAAFGSVGVLAIVWGRSTTPGLRALLLAGRLGLDLGALALVGLACHRSLAESKPAQPEAAARFYAWLAAGAWLGSALVAVAIPLVARRSGILTLDWLLAAALAGFAAALAGPARRRWIAAGAGAAAAACLAGARLWSLPASARVLETRRSFYGVYTVTEDAGVRAFYHGNTRHGVQYVDAERRRRPVSYFHEDGPVGEVFGAFGRSSRRVAVVGLGVGVLAAYARPGQQWDFYELDPEVVRLARDRFTYLADSSAQWRVATGDARLELADAAADTPPYDLLFVDAFHSDAMPVHLATREAMELYFDRLTPEGTLLVHVSSRFLDLRPMFAGMAAGLRLAGATKRLEPGPMPKAEGAIDPSTWVALARKPETLSPLLSKGWTDLSGWPKARPWTDQHASLLSALLHR